MKIAIRLDEERNQDTMDQIAALYEQINPGFAFKYSFHDDDRADSYKTEEKTISLAGYAAVLAITISCLGIFGLISFVTERKSKEIGIRKILGASAGTLSWFLYKDFRMPITASGIIGTLIAFYLCEKWLAKFVYHIQLEWSFFLAPFIIMILLTVLTLGARVFKAVKDDPVIALRDE